MIYYGEQMNTGFIFEEDFFSSLQATSQSFGLKKVYDKEMESESVSN